MPKRTDLLQGSRHRFGADCDLAVGTFDYSGTQACKALKAEGYEVVLANSNPATIMTDPELADRTYIEPLTHQYVEEILRIESRDGGAGERSVLVLPTVGGQTALNLAVDLCRLRRSGTSTMWSSIGAKLEAIKKAEDRLLVQRRDERIGLDLPAPRWLTIFATAWSSLGRSVFR